MNSAKTMVFYGHGKQISPEEHSIPSLHPGEILVKNRYTSICGSDLHTFCGLRNEKMPTVLGHEIVGEVLAFADSGVHQDYLGNNIEIGDRVTWSIFASDPNTQLAKAGMPQKSDGLFKYGHALLTGQDALHGGLSTHCILKKGTAVIRISEDIPLPVAAIINCAVATVAGAVRLAGSVAGKNVLITGSGLLGLVCSAICKQEGAESIHVADLQQSRLNQAVAFGADFVYNTATNDALVNAADIVFDMSGSPDAMEAGLAALNIGGIAVWVGAVFNTRKVQVDAESIVRRLITVKGLHNYNFDDFVYAVNFITQYHQKFPFKEIVSKEFELVQAQQAFDYAVKEKPLRVGIQINE
ncbi:zinc-binding dehydrogenase [Pedobacter agri]|uniref:zinc-binding dehydrogenase n=1 Tax=Pedobacter agri TaxID=454586 RepID=UPI00292D7A73|nr:zinc-binding dehydrogenase [Pedobacter agri]